MRDSYYPGYADPGFDTLHDQLHLDWNPVSHRLSGVAAIRFRMLRDQRSATLALGAPLQVAAVLLDGRHVGYTHAGNRLSMTIGRLSVGSLHTVTITYAGVPKPVAMPTSRTDVTTGGFHIGAGGVAYAQQEPYGAFTWYPVNDQPSDKSFYDAVLVAHHGQIGVFGGTLTRFVRHGAETDTSFHLDRPAASYLVVVAFDHFLRQVVRGPHGLPVTYWYTSADTAAMQIVRKSPQIVAWLETKLGPYPFSSGGVLLVPDPSDEETQSLISMGSSVHNLGTVRTYQIDLAHEWAHQWFGDEVTPRDWSDLWLNEGLTTYLQFEYTEHANLGGTLAGAISYNRGQDNFYRARYGPPGAYAKGSFASDNVYYSPAVMLDELRQAYGAVTFDRALAAWPSADGHRYGNADRYDFESFMSRALGPGAGAFIQKWITARSTPPPYER